MADLSVFQGNAVSDLQSQVKMLVAHVRFQLCLLFEYSSLPPFRSVPRYPPSLFSLILLPSYIIQENLIVDIACTER